MNVGGEFLNVRCPRPEADREDSFYGTRIGVCALMTGAERPMNDRRVLAVDDPFVRARRDQPDSMIKDRKELCDDYRLFRMWT
jgi:hypothetical protein